MSVFGRKTSRSDFSLMTVSSWMLILWAAVIIGCSSSEEAKVPDSEPASDEEPTLNEAAQVDVGSSSKTGGFIGYPVLCRQEWVDLAEWIPPIAEGFQQQVIMYDSIELSDCSGMFHRVLRAFDEGCPGYSLPQPESDRDSRDVARWYHGKSLFTPVRDELSHVDLIKPGAVMFYGHSNKTYEGADLEEILREVEHVGVVVSVERDAGGDLVGYRLFHGRSPGKPAGITDYHLREPTRPTHRPFGNWDQQWIGVAPLAHSSLRESTSS